MASIKDVAKAAGVSTATVSRVLSNGEHVRPEVRKRVMAAVEQLTYRPNLLARSLRSQQTTTIGLIVSDIRNPFFTSISRAVEDTAYEQGYSLFLCNTDENPEKEAIYLNLTRYCWIMSIRPFVLPCIFWSRATAVSPLCVVK